MFPAAIAAQYLPPKRLPAVLAPVRRAKITTLLVPFKVKGKRFLVRLTRDGSLVRASCEVATPWGPVVVSSECDERLVRAVLESVTRSTAFQAARAFAVAGDETRAGDVWGDIGDFFTKTIPAEAKKLTRTKVFRDVAQGISEVTSHPGWTGAMLAINVIPGYGQAISAAMGGMKMASAGLNLLAQAKQGNPKAVERVKEIDKRAMAGDKSAQKAMGVMQGLNSLPPAALAKAPTAGQQAASVAQGVMGLGSQLAGQFGGDTQAGKAAQGALNLGGSIAGAFKPGADAGSTVSNILGSAAQFASAFMGDDAPIATGGMPGLVSDAAYETMKRQIAAETAAENPLETTVGDDGIYYVAGVPKPYKVTPRKSYGLPPPRFVGTPPVVTHALARVRSLKAARR